MFSGLSDFLKDAFAFTLIGAPAAIARTLMKREFTWTAILSNGASCAFVAPLAGWTANYLFPATAAGETQGITYVIIGVSTLLGKDMIEGVLREGDNFRQDPRGTAQAWLTFWKNLFIPGSKS